ncbi:hypothetical protein KCP75_24070 [Salmonella enterica subsp. enterica]|nr:hypothetical protein KCP75_24070 [Salmonella enterica subsp. enterica]
MTSAVRDGGRHSVPGFPSGKWLAVVRGIIGRLTRAGGQPDWQPPRQRRRAHTHQRSRSTVTATPGKLQRHHGLADMACSRADR